VCAKLGRIPSYAEYMETVGNKLQNVAEIYKYLSFDQMPDYSASMAKAKKIIAIAEVS